MEDASRRDLVSSAALTVLIAEGSRGLTHRAVDAAAGLRPGSVNYYFDSRDKLLGAAFDEMFRQGEAAAAQTMARHARLFTEPDMDGAARGLAEVIEEFTGPDAAPRLRAQQELLCEAQRRPTFQARFEQQHREFVGFAESLLNAVGVAEAHLNAEALVILHDGLMRRQVLLLGLPRLSLTELTSIIHTWLAAASAVASPVL